jgi:hypothetical protein
MDLFKIIKYGKLVLKIITILPVIVEGIKSLVKKVHDEIEEEGFDL